MTSFSHCAFTRQNFKPEIFWFGSQAYQAYQAYTVWGVPERHLIELLDMEIIDMPKPELVTHPEIIAALARVESEIDAATANVLRARIQVLESQVAELLRELETVESEVAEEQTRTAILTAFDTR